MIQENVVSCKTILNEKANVVYEDLLDATWVKDLSTGIDLITGVDTIIDELKISYQSQIIISKS